MADILQEDIVGPLGGAVMRHLRKRGGHYLSIEGDPIDGHPTVLVRFIGRDEGQAVETYNRARMAVSAAGRPS